MKPNVVSLPTTLRNCPQQRILFSFNSAKTNTNQSVRWITTCNYPQWVINTLDKYLPKQRETESILLFKKKLERMP